MFIGVNIWQFFVVNQIPKVLTGFNSSLMSGDVSSHIQRIGDKPISDFGKDFGFRVAVFSVFTPGVEQECHGDTGEYGDELKSVIGEFSLFGRLLHEMKIGKFELSQSYR